MPKTDQPRHVTPQRLQRITAWANRKPRIALMGEFSSGKSTLLNLLIGEALLPTKVTATELPPVWFSHGGPRSWWVDQDGQEHRMDFGSFDGIPRSARYVRVFTPSPMLERCDILDTPGISDPNLEEDSWRFAVGQANFVLWCTSSTQAWRETERSTWAALPERLRANSVLVVTRSDKLGPEDREKVRRRLARESFGLFGGLVFISTLDAMRGLEALTRGGGSAQWDASGGAELDARVEAGLEAIRAERLDLLERYATGEPAALREPATVVVLPRAVAFAESPESYDVVRPRRVEVSEIRRTGRPASDEEAADPLSSMRSGWNARRPDDAEERPAPVLRLADPIRPLSQPGWAGQMDHDEPLLLDPAWATPSDEVAPRLDPPLAAQPETEPLDEPFEDDTPAIAPRAFGATPEPVAEPLILTAPVAHEDDAPEALDPQAEEPAPDTVALADDEPTLPFDLADEPAADLPHEPVALEAEVHDDAPRHEVAASDAWSEADAVAEPPADATDGAPEAPDAWAEHLPAEAAGEDAPVPAIEDAPAVAMMGDDAPLLAAGPHHEPDLAMDTVMVDEPAREPADAPLLDLSTLAAEFEAAEDDPAWDAPAPDAMLADVEGSAPDEAPATEELRADAPEAVAEETAPVAADAAEPGDLPEPVALLSEPEAALPVHGEPEPEPALALEGAPEPEALEDRPAAVLWPVEPGPAAAEAELPRAVRIWRDIVARSPEIPSNGPMVAMIDQLLCELSRDDELSDGIAANPATIVGQTRAA